MTEENRSKAETDVRDSQPTRKDIIDKVLTQQPDDEILYDLAELFKVFGDSTRIKILYIGYVPLWQSSKHLAERTG